jgi:hypothetical protein
MCITPLGQWLLLAALARRPGVARIIVEQVQMLGQAASVRFRNGLAFTAVTALRRKNLAEMEIGGHLCRRGDRLWVVFDASVKNQEIFDVPLAEFPAPYMERYLTHHRPALLQGHADIPAAGSIRKAGCCLTAPITCCSAGWG